MTRKHAIRTTIALMHLTLVACGAASVWPSAPGRAGTAARWYGEVTAASNGYAYFAPTVGSPTRVSFVLSDQSGAWADTLDEGGSAETRIRVGTAVLKAGDTELRSKLAAAWAARMLAKHPTASQVVVRIEAHHIPTMNEYREGAAPRWETVYEATYRRNEERHP